MIRYLLIPVLFAGVTFGQVSSRDNLLGRYTGIERQNSAYPCAASFSIQSSALYYPEVYVCDTSCTTGGGWSSYGGFMVFNDSTIRDSYSQTIVCGRLYPNDSLYVYWYLPCYMCNVKEEFFGFKIKNDVGINELPDPGLKIEVYPNPCSDKLMINSPIEIEIKKYHLLTIDGKEIILPPISKNQFNLNSLPEGLYFLKVETAKGMLTKRIVVQH